MHISEIVEWPEHIDLLLSPPLDVIHFSVDLTPEEIAERNQILSAIRGKSDSTLG